MQSEANSGTGILQRRVAAGTPHFAYATLKVPDGLPGLYIDAPPVCAGLSSGESARGFVLTKEKIPTSGRIRFLLVLSEKRFTDLFQILAGDVLAHALNTADQEAGAGAFIARVARWKRFLEAAGESGLSFEAQLGLAGELFLLKLFVANYGIPAATALTAWIGPDRRSKDFVFANVAVEVKTTAALLPERIRITNEYQLDPENLDALFLAHIAFNATANFGETLPELVRSTADTLGPALSGEFFERLANAGYLECDAEKYIAICYALRSLQPYLVTRDFPKIAARDLPQGVSGVSYSVELGHIASFATVIEEITQAIPNNSGS